MQVEIEDVSPDYGALALQGPTSRALLQSLVEGDLSDLGYFRIVDEKIAGVPLRISRTGFTGDLGYELFVEAEHAETLWDALLEHGLDYQMRPAGLRALDMARIEAGLVQLDADFTSTRQTIFDVQRSTPYELGLGWTVKLKKDFFVAAGKAESWKTNGNVIECNGTPNGYICTKKMCASCNIFINP
jgi:aminomethyltransferase